MIRIIAFRSALGSGPMLAGIMTALSMSQAMAETPPFDSTADTVFDIIRAEDESLFQCLEPQGQAARQIWDKRVDGEPVVKAEIFLARYSDGTTTEIAVNPEFGDRAMDEALPLARALGQLPTALRQGVKRLSVHDGDEGFHAGTGQIVVYAGRVRQRMSYNHLEESLFHEAVHASWDEQWRLSPEWRAAQQSDAAFLTSYAAESPDREDLAETALFAFAILHHPDRLPPNDTTATLRVAGQRVAFIAGLLPQDQPLTYSVGPSEGCLSQ